MRINNTMENKLIGKTISMLSRVLDYRSTNHKVIAGNLANIDTPGFRPKDVSFDRELQRATDKNHVRLQTTDPGHLSGSSIQADGSFDIVTREIGPFESDRLNIDAEMAKMMKNNLLYEVSTRLLTKKFLALKNVIGEGKR